MVAEIAWASVAATTHACHFEAAPATRRQALSWVSRQRLDGRHQRLEAAHGQRPACAASTAGSFARLLDFVPFVVLVVSILERMQCVPAVERSRLQTSQNSRCSFRTWASRFAHVLMHLAPNHTIDSDHQGQTRTPTAPLLQRFQMIQRATPGLLWAHSRCPVHDNATMTACTLFIARWPVHAGHAKKCLGRVGKPRTLADILGLETGPLPILMQKPPR